MGMRREGGYVFFQMPPSTQPEPKTEIAVKLPPASPLAGAGWRGLLAPTPQAEIASRQIHYLLKSQASRLTGQLTLELRYRDLLKSGEWGALKLFRAELWPEALREQDRAVSTLEIVDRTLLGLLLSPLNRVNSDAVAVDDSLLTPILERLFSSGRFYRFNADDAGDDFLVMTAGDLTMGDLTTRQKSWVFEIEVLETPLGFSLEGVLRRGRERLRLESASATLKNQAALILLKPGFFFRGSAVEHVSWGANFRLARHLAAHSIFVPKRDEVDLALRAFQEEGLPPFKLPASLEWPIVDVQPEALASIHQEGESLFSFKFNFVYGACSYEARRPGGLGASETAGKKYGVDSAKKVRFKRNLKFEREKVAEVQSLLTKFKESELPAAIGELQDKHWQVFFGDQEIVPLTAVSGKLQLRGLDEFQLAASFEFRGEPLEWSAFFAACARGERRIRLASNKIALVPDGWVEKVDLLLRGSKLEPGGELLFQRAALPLFRPVFDEMTGLEVDEHVGAVFSGLAQLLTSGSSAKPVGLRATLRSYQEEGLNWLERISASGFGGILADDMGLGKTVQVIAYLLRRATEARTGPRPSLVVVPKSLVFNWLGEIQKFGPSLRVLDFAGPARGLLRVSEYDVVVTTYHVLKNELDRFEKLEFDTIILDEAQAIKNAGSQIARAVCQLQGRHRFALSGTPIENSLADLFSLMRFANPGLIPRGLEASLSGKAGSIPKEALKRISVAVSPFILRRTKKQVLTELPDKTEQVLVCELEGDQKKMYERLRKQYRDSIKKEVAGSGSGLPKNFKMQILEALLRLRQASCHPGLVDPQFAKASSAKFENLLEHLEEIRSAGHKALVFSQFTSLLALLKPHLEKRNLSYEYLDGKTRDRGAVVDRFNSTPSTPVFLISLKAGGTGLNLTTASYVFLLDPWWNPAIEAQAIDRAYRMGQTQKVMAYRLIAEGTIEEKILRLQGKKRSLAEMVVNEDPDFLRTLSIEDLAGLFE